MALICDIATSSLTSLWPLLVVNDMMLQDCLLVVAIGALAR